MANREVKQVLIPEGLNGERADAALSRVLGISRTVTTTLIESGEVKRNGREITKSEKVLTGEHFEVLMPEVKITGVLIPTPLPDLNVIYDDEDVIVIDKPVGVDRKSTRLNSSHT